MGIQLYCYILFITYISISSQSLNNSIMPNNPCAQHFSYVKENGIYYGKIVIPSNFTTDIIRIHTVFYLPKYFIEHNNGKIKKMDHTWIDFCQTVKQNKSMQFKIDFPVQNPVPVINRIIVNDVKICTGPEELYWGTKIWHKYYLKYWCPFDTRFLYGIEKIKSEGEVKNNSKDDSVIGRIAPQTLPKGLENDVKLNNSEPEPSNTNILFQVIQVFSPRSSLPKDNAICGQVNSSTIPLITGGIKIQEKIFPWLGAIFHKSFLICAGNLISSRHMLTAAHCLQGKNIDNLYVKLGKIHSIDLNDGEISVNVKSINIHPDYKKLDNNLVDADIAIITLERPIDVTSRFRPICLYNEDKRINDLVDQSATIAGWGRTENVQDISPVLRSTNVNIKSLEECTLIYSNLSQSRSFCAGADQKGPCHGDSGGGLYLRKKGIWFIKGIISSAPSHSNDLNCRLVNTALYTDITPFVDWINEGITRFLH